MSPKLTATLTLAGSNANMRFDEREPICSRLVQRRNASRWIKPLVVYDFRSVKE
jgi:hypothetical protein